MCVRVCVCVLACVCACVRACVRVCMCDKDNLTLSLREVCKRLGMGHLISGFQLMTSPTKELISYFEVCICCKIYCSMAIHSILASVSAS